MSNPLYYSGSGNDRVTTGDGNDRVRTGSGDDIVSLGGGNDTAYLGSGDDQVNFVWSENVTSSNAYHGQSGNDTFRIVLSADEANDPDVIEDIEAFKAHIASGSSQAFHFSSINLVASGFENVEILVPVNAMDDSASAREDGPPVLIDVLANDTGGSTSASQVTGSANARSLN